MSLSICALGNAVRFLRRDWGTFNSEVSNSHLPIVRYHTAKLENHSNIQQSSTKYQYILVKLIYFYFGTDAIWHFHFGSGKTFPSSILSNWDIRLNRHESIPKMIFFIFPLAPPSYHMLLIPVLISVGYPRAEEWDIVCEMWQRDPPNVRALSLFILLGVFAVFRGVDPSNPSRDNGILFLFLSLLSTRIPILLSNDSAH